MCDRNIQYAMKHAMKQAMKQAWLHEWVNCGAASKVCVSDTATNRWKDYFILLKHSRGPRCSLKVWKLSFQILHLLHCSTVALLPATVSCWFTWLLSAITSDSWLLPYCSFLWGIQPYWLWLHHTCSAWAWHNGFVLLFYWFIYFLFLKSAFWQPFQYCWDLLFLLHSILSLSIFLMLLLLDPSLTFLSRRCWNLNHIHVLVEDLDAVEKRQNCLRWMVSI